MSETNEDSEAHFGDGPNSSDDREQVRYTVDCTVTVNSEHNFYAGFVQNLSKGGIFIATHIVHPIGTKFNLSIHIDDGSPGVVRGVGEVRWIRPPGGGPQEPAGLGIQFTLLEGDGQERIERFLERRSPMVMDEETTQLERSASPDAGNVDPASLVSDLDTSNTMDDDETSSR